MADPGSDARVAECEHRFRTCIAECVRGFFREHQWAVIVALWVVAYALGCVGTAKQLAASGVTRSASEPFYRALQLFFLDDGMITDGPLASWELEVARFLAPTAAFYAAVAACLALFRDRLQMARLRYARHHVVICGLGRKGLTLAADFRSHGDRVVVIERDEANKGLATCRELGIAVLIGDATEPSVLKKARVAAAKYVVAICGEDGTNAEIALQAYELVQHRPRHLTGTVRCFVHIVEVKLCALFSQHRIFADFEDCFEAMVFNIYQNSARMLFEEHPPDRGQIVAGDLRPAYVIVLGFGRMGESVALQVARSGHYASGQRPRLTIVDSEAEAKKRSFYSRYPQFEQTCTAEFISSDVEDPEILEQVRRGATDPATVATVVVALDDDGRSLSCALNILSRLAGRVVPLIVRMSDDAGLAALLDSDVAGADSLTYVFPFGMPGCACTRKMLLNDELDVVAKAIHERYVAQRRREAPAASDPSTRPWERLDPGLKDSNRQQADHLRVKLRAIGCYGAKDEAGKVPVSVLSDADVELLARMEHARWNAERFLAGWRLGEKDVRARTSPYLVDWQDLPDAIKEYDRQAVRDLPRLLQLIGEKIYRRD